MEQIAKILEVRKSIFVMLLLKIPVAISKDERTFSRQKIAKVPLRIKMGDKRLEFQLILPCEKDITESIGVDVTAKDWENIKTRIIKFI